MLKDFKKNVKCFENMRISFLEVMIVVVVVVIFNELFN
jgi:hypothetical protein